MTVKMTKNRRLLFLSRRDERPDYDTARSMAAALQPQATDIMYESCHLEEVAFLYDGSELEVVNTRNGEDLRNYDGIFLLAWFKLRNHEEVALAVSLYAQAYGIKILNSEALFNRSKGKLSQCVAAVLNKIATTPFVMAIDHNVLSGLIEKSAISYPLIVKSITGSRGRHNYLVTDAESLGAALSQAPTKAMIVQTFVHNDGDFRVLVMGGEVALVIHRRANTDSHLNNTSQGGAASLVDLRSPALSVAMLDDAVKISKLLRREVTGVDMIVDKKTGQHYFLEVNNMPQLSTGSFTEAKAEVLNSYFDRWIGHESDITHR